MLAIQRKKNSLDLYNVDNGGQIDTVEYTLTTKVSLAVFTVYVVKSFGGTMYIYV